jgi:type II secretory pathway pseudopilin PulG
VRLSRALRNIRKGQGGFNVTELTLVMVLMGLIVGIGIWVLSTSQSGQAAKSGQTQLANDLRIAATKAEVEKKTYGIKIRNYDSTDAKKNKYTFIKYESGAVTEIDPPQGASKKTHDIALDSGARIYRLLPSSEGWEDFGTAPNDYSRQMSILFVPVGGLLYTQYDSTGAGTTLLSLTSDVTIQFAPADNTTMIRSIKVYPLGEAVPED